MEDGSTDAGGARPDDEPEPGSKDGRSCQWRLYQRRACIAFRPVLAQLFYVCMMGSGLDSTKQCPQCTALQVIPPMIVLYFSFLPCPLNRSNASMHPLLGALVADRLFKHEPSCLNSTSLPSASYFSPWPRLVSTLQSLRRYWPPQQLTKALSGASCAASGAPLATLPTMHWHSRCLIGGPGCWCHAHP
jgi:hypothetical protein